MLIAEFHLLPQVPLVGTQGLCGCQFGLTLFGKG